MISHYKNCHGIRGKLARAAARLIFRIIIIQQYLFLRKQAQPRFELKWADRWLHVRDATQLTSFDRHYVYHTSWACRVLAERRPASHVDVSSSLYFVGLASAFIPMRFLDYRPADLVLNGLECRSGNLHALPFRDGEVESISCMHVIEHIGLGRYGDPIDYDGDIKAASELSRVVARGGLLLIVVPVGGVARIQFNAHRIYTYNQVIQMFSGKKLLEFALISNESSNGGLIRNADESLVQLEKYGCGCFLFEG